MEKRDYLQSQIDQLAAVLRKALAQLIGGDNTEIQATEIIAEIADESTTAFKSRIEDPLYSWQNKELLAEALINLQEKNGSDHMERITLLLDEIDAETKCFSLHRHDLRTRADLLTR